MLGFLAPFFRQVLCDGSWWHMQEAETLLSDARKLLRIHDSVHEVRSARSRSIIPCLCVLREFPVACKRTAAAGGVNRSLEGPRNQSTQGWKAASAYEPWPRSINGGCSGGLCCGNAVQWDEHAGRGHATRARTRAHSRQQRTKTTAKGWR